MKCGGCGWAEDGEEEMLTLHDSKKVENASWSLEPPAENFYLEIWIIDSHSHKIVLSRRGKRFLTAGCWHFEVCMRMDVCVCVCVSVCGVCVCVYVCVSVCLSSTLDRHCPIWECAFEGWKSFSISLTHPMAPALFKGLDHFCSRSFCFTSFALKQKMKCNIIHIYLKIKFILKVLKSLCHWFIFWHIYGHFIRYAHFAGFFGVFFM